MEEVSDDTFPFCNQQAEALFKNVTSKGIGSFYSDAINVVCETLGEAFYPHFTCEEESHEVHCGYIFENGDLIYRCKDCSADETCVLCQQCFKFSDHKDHRVSFSISKGSGGSCDCGEAESWSKTLHCDRHGDATRDFEIPTATSIDPVKADEFSVEFFKSLFSFMADHLEHSLACIDDYSHEPCLVLYNDEKHSFDQVINVLKTVDFDGFGIKVEGSDANSSLGEVEVADFVDKHGMVALVSHHSCQLEEMEVARNRVGEIGLDCRLQNFQSINMIAYLRAILYWIVQANVIDSGISTRQSIFEALTWNGAEGSPLDRIFFLDSKLIKGIRKDLGEILTKCALYCTSNKIVLGKILARQFEPIFEGFWSEQREPELSIVHFFVQVFTVSSVLKSLLEEKSPIIKNAIDILSSKVVQNSRLGGRAFMQTRIYSLTLFIRFFLEDPVILKSGLLLQDEYLFGHWLNLLSTIPAAFGKHVRRRPDQDHIEWENPNWIGYFTFCEELSTMTLLLVKHFSSASPTLVSTALSESIQMAYTQVVRFDFDEICFPQEFSFYQPQWYPVWRFGCLAHQNGSLMEDFLWNSGILSNVWIVMKATAAINQGLWVRNGMSMRQQTMLCGIIGYRHAFLDCFIGIGKLAALSMQPADFIQWWKEVWKVDTILYRQYSLITKEQQSGLISDMISHLFGILYGVHLRAAPSDDTSDPSTLEAIREACIAALCLGPADFSKIKGRLPENYLNHPNFDEIFSSLSVAVPPTASSDLLQHSAQFEIRSEIARSNYDPYFWLYTASDRQKSLEYMKRRHSFNNMFRSIPSSSMSMRELRMLSRLVTSTDFLDLIKLFLQSDLLLTESRELLLSLLGLLLVAFKDQSNDFPRLFSEITNIYEHVSANDQSSAQLIKDITETISLIDSDQSSSQILHNDEEKLKRDMLVKKKQRLALDKLKASQNAFKEAHQSHLSIENVTENNGMSECMAIVGTCLICQEATGPNSAPYGALGGIHFTVDDIEQRSTVITSCHHLVHFDCWSRRPENRRSENESCPLCAAYTNILIPIVPVYYPVTNDVMSTLASLRTALPLDSSLALPSELSHECDYLDVGIPPSFSVPQCIAIVERSQKQNRQIIQIMCRTGPNKERQYSAFLNSLAETIGLAADLWDYSSEQAKAIETARLLKEFVTVYALLGYGLDQRLRWTQHLQFLSGQSDSMGEDKPLDPFCIVLWALIYFGGSPSLHLFNNLPVLLRLCRYASMLQVQHLCEYKIQPHDPEKPIDYQDIRKREFGKFLRQLVVLLGLWYDKSVFNLEDAGTDTEQLLSFFGFSTTFSHFCTQSRQPNLLPTFQIRPFEVDSKMLSTHDTSFAPLISLGERYDLLYIKIMSEAFCWVTRKKPVSPALCLICGEIVCARSACCGDGEIGGCTAHMKNDHGSMGIFLLLRESVVLLHSWSRSMILPAPFTDRYDQTDLGLRHGSFLYFRKERYREYARLWLSRGIPSFLSMRAKAASEMEEETRIIEEGNKAF